MWAALYSDILRYRHLLRETGLFCGSRGRPPPVTGGGHGGSSDVGNTGDTGSQLDITGIILSHGPCMMIFGLLECYPLGPGVTIHTFQLSAEKFL